MVDVLIDESARSIAEYEVGTSNVIGFEAEAKVAVTVRTASVQSIVDVSLLTRSIVIDWHQSRRQPTAVV